MAELADALDLGSSGHPPCRFDSCYPHKKSQDDVLALFYADGEPNQSFGLRFAPVGAKQTSPGRLAPCYPH